MTLEEALKKGYLNLSDDEAREVLDAIFDQDEPETRLGQALSLMQTFIADDKIDAVLHLSALILDAETDMEEYDDENDEDEDDDDDGKR